MPRMMPPDESTAGNCALTEKKLFFTGQECAELRSP